MKVQKFIREKGLQALKDELGIEIKEYEDRVVLNYSQTESPRFHPICDECRALILERDTWRVLSRSFDRFYNLHEGCNPSQDGNIPVRIAATENIETIFQLEIKDFVVQHKVDGSLISVYHDGEKWCAATRKMAFGEGCIGGTSMTFADLFWQTANSKYDLMSHLNKINIDEDRIVFIFELIGPFNRIVTRYPETDIILLGCRHMSQSSLDLSYERDSDGVQSWAEIFGVKTPTSYHVNSFEELLNLVDSMPALEEGVVLCAQGRAWHGYLPLRVKVKNPKYLAIANLRNNGIVSAKNILRLIRENEHHEYLSYFPEDVKYFDYVTYRYNEIIEQLEYVWNEVKDIENQKDFALTMMPMTKCGFESGVLFACKKKGISVEEALSAVDVKKICDQTNLTDDLLRQFGFFTA